jgi:hypothetical protein
LPATTHSRRFAPDSACGRGARWAPGLNDRKKEEEEEKKKLATELDPKSSAGEKSRFSHFWAIVNTPDGTEFWFDDVAANLVGHRTRPTLVALREGGGDLRDY